MRATIRSAIIDTNLLLLLIVGDVDPNWLEKHRRTRQYTPEDYTALEALLRHFTALATTPHILAETSNLLSQTDVPRRIRLRERLADYVALAEEVTTSADSIVIHRAYVRVGITDVAIRLAAAGHHLVLTDDVALYLMLLEENIDVINFTHHRRLLS